MRVDTASLHGPSFADARLIALAGREGMSTLSRWQARVLSPDVDIDLERAVGEAVSLVLGDADGSTRTLELLVAEAWYEGPARDGLHLYELTLVDFVWPLGLRSGYRNFVAQTPQQVVDLVLRDAGLAASRVEWRLRGRYVQRPQCVQYGESDWGFVERLLAEEGISYWFEHGDPGVRLVLGDDTSAHSDIQGVRVPFDEGDGMRGVQAAVHGVVRVERMAPEAVAVRDFDLRQPEVPVDGGAGSGSLEHFHFPAGVLVAEAAAARAAVRLDQLRRDACALEAESSCVRFEPGRWAQIDGVHDDLAEGRWLVTDVEHELRLADRSGGDAVAYRARVTLVPREIGGQPHVHRPPMAVAPPRICGVETAVVTGPPGEEIHVDDMGRVKLAFRWDPSGIGDDRSSCWARTVQPQMGGSMLLPRVGWEVSVAYLDGNPEEPIVLGHLYNGDNAAPYGLPLASAVSAFRSDTSPHDGTSNEIRMADDAGKQEMKIHASGTQAVSVGGSAVTTVAVNEAHDVLGGLARSIGGAQTIGVGATQEIIVGSAHPTKVGGARAESIGGSETIGVAKNRRMAVGSYSEIIGAIYGLQCNTASTTVSGAYTELVGGNRVAMAGMGVNESVAGARLEAVGGSLNVTAGSAYADDTKGTKTINAGSCKIASGAKLVVVGGSVRLMVGGSARFAAGEPLALEGDSVTLRAASIGVDGGSSLTVAGSAKIAGKSKLDAPTVQRHEVNEDS